MNRPFGWRFTAPLFIGSALNPINSSLIATALVPISLGLAVSIGQTAGLVSVLYLASAVAQPTAGKAADVFGPRRVFLVGIVLVLIGGLVGGAGSSLTALLVGRVLIGLGTSCANPTAMVLIRRRAKTAGLQTPPGAVLGGLQVAAVATASLGLPVGGILVELFGWRAVFLVNLPLTVVAFTTTVLWIPADEDRERRSIRDTLALLDVVGIVGFAAAMTSLLLFLQSLPTPMWELLGLSVALWAVVTWWQLRTPSPFLDLRLLARHTALTRTYLRFAAVMLCSYLVLYGVTQWLQAALGLSSSLTGLLLLPMTLVSGAVTIPVSRRNLVRTPLLLAALSCVVAGTGVLLLSFWSWLWIVVAVTVLLGFSQGLGGTSNTLVLYTQAPDEHLGTASGLLRSFGYIGSIASAAVIGLVFPVDATDTGLSVIGAVIVAVSVGLLVLTLTDWRRLPPDAVH